MKFRLQEFDLHKVLKGLSTFDQPRGSEICWAVCLCNIYNGLFKNKITYCEVLGSTNHDCVCTLPNGNLKVHPNFDFNKQPEDLGTAASEIGLTLNDYEINKIGDFETIRSVLENEKVPIIFQTNYNIRQ